MSTSNFQSQEEFEAYLAELGIKYHYSCFRENDGPTCHLLGDWYVVHKKYEEAVSQYKMTCEKYQFPRSCYKSGLAYLSQENNVEDNLEKAIKYFKTACDLGEPEGCFMAGVALKKGNFPFDALTYFERHCGLKHHSSDKGCHQASVMHIQGKSKSSIPIDFKKGFEFALKGCELGNAKCCLNLSVMYRNGDGVKKDVSLADQYQKTAKELVNKTLPDHMKI